MSLSLVAAMLALKPVLLLPDPVPERLLSPLRSRTSAFAPVNQASVGLGKEQ